MAAAVPTTDRITVAKPNASFHHPASTDQTVYEPCPENRGGYQVCETHRFSAQHNLGWSFHIDEGRHRVAWFCFEHGFEGEMGA